MSADIRVVNAIKRFGANAAHMVAQPRAAIVDTVDPVHHTARVRIMPEDVLTGDLPIAVQAISGAVLVSLPTPGDQVVLVPQEGSIDGYIVLGCMFSDRHVPPVSPVTGQPAQSGEIFGILTGGSYFHMQAGGDVHIVAAGEMVQTAAKDFTLNCVNFKVNASAGMQVTTPSITQTGSIEATGNIQSGADIEDVHGPVQTLRADYNAHTHVDSRGGATGTPTPQVPE